MRHRHPVPRLWLMTDERMDDLWRALAQLPRGSGVVFRHYATWHTERQHLFGKVLRIAQRRGLIVVVGGRDRLNGDGIHGIMRATGSGFRTWPAHNRAQAIAGVRAGADAVFVSPIFATRSHPGAKSLGPMRAAMIGRGLNVPLIALGGMDARRFKRLRSLGFHGWAAIDAWQRV